MRYTYYIYYIEGIKIGCTTDLIKRMADQGFTEWEILWQEEGDYDFGWIAGDKEIELQKEYGLPIDKSNYQISRQNRPKWNAASIAKGQRTLETNGNRTGGIPYLDKETAFRVASAGGKVSRTMTMEQANEIRSKYVKKYGMFVKLAKEYNTTEQVIKGIIYGKTYQN